MKREASTVGMLSTSFNSFGLGAYPGMVPDSLRLQTPFVRLDPLRNFLATT